MRRSLILLAVLGAFLLFGAVSPTTLAEEGDTPSAEAAAHGEVHAADDHGGGHGSEVVPVLLALVVILVSAKMGGAFFERFGQPAVLGELVVGMIIGNLTLMGIGGLEFIETNAAVAILAELGVILLLFEVGLESNVKEMMSVGVSSLAVAILGVIVPFFLGWGLSAWMLPQYETLVHVFIGATLCATSVGITARVLADLGKISARESKIVLGAAVIDDVLGLVILAVVSGIIAATNAGTVLEFTEVFLIIGKAVVFLVGALALGSWISPRLFRIASKMKTAGVLLSFSLAFCFVLAYIAKLIQLEPIVGAFAAGLILEQVHYKDFLDRGEHGVEELLHPLTAFLVPIFFILTGAKVDLTNLARTDVLGFALLLSLFAILGKMICAIGVLEKGLDRISVAVGMVPRGEVGLIFAGIGASLVLHGKPVIDEAVFAAVVIMVMITTLATPPTLKITLARGDRKKALLEAKSEQS